MYFSKNRPINRLLKKSNQIMGTVPQCPLFRPFWANFSKIHELWKPQRVTLLQILLTRAVPALRAGLKNKNTASGLVGREEALQLPLKFKVVSSILLQKTSIKARTHSNALWTTNIFWEKLLFSWIWLAVMWLCIIQLQTSESDRSFQLSKKCLWG